VKGLAGQITRGMPQGGLLRARLNEVRSVADFGRLLDEYRTAVRVAAPWPAHSRATETLALTPA